MNIIIPPKRRDGRSSFVQLVGYVSVRDDISLKDELKDDERFKRPARSRGKVFERLTEYMNRSSNLTESAIISISSKGTSRVSVDGVISQHNLISLESAASEMNGVARQNSRVKDPVYHFILSWPEDEKPNDDLIFSSARHAIRGMGMGQHQYVASIHRDTDNVHVHVAVNRVHPLTFKVADIHNDADRMQKISREIELKFNFKVDNGSWVRDSNNNIVRAKMGYKKAPRGAAGLEHFADKESLYSYAVTHCRRDINAMFRNKNTTWEGIHDVFNRAGLQLETYGKGMVIRDVFNPSQVPIKASRLHTSMTLSRLEKKIGPYQPSTSSSEKIAATHTHPIYNELLHKRDRGAREERRLARAEARQQLKDDYQVYRKSWRKPDLNAAARFRDIATEFREKKNRVRTGHNDPHMRKLMYNVVEFEREKAMAGLRLQLKAEREALRESGQWRPMNYRTWTEKEALTGRQAAVSQLRGWAYREGRQHRTPVRSEYLIHCAIADDTAALRVDGFKRHIHRDGVVSYTQNGVVGMVDHGDKVEVFDPHAKGGLHTDTAVDMVSWKSGEHIRYEGPGLFKESAINATIKHNLVHPDAPVIISDSSQREIGERMLINMRTREATYENGLREFEARQQRLRDRYDDEPPAPGSHFKP